MYTRTSTTLVCFWYWSILTQSHARTHSLRPSESCGPFRGRDYMYSIIPDLINTITNCAAQQALEYFGSFGFVVPVVILLLWAVHLCSHTQEIARLSLFLSLSHTQTSDLCPARDFASKESKIHSYQETACSGKYHSKRPPLTKPHTLIITSLWHHHCRKGRMLHILSVSLTEHCTTLQSRVRRRTLSTWTPRRASSNAWPARGRALTQSRSPLCDLLVAVTKLLL